ncbi:GNAT family N-acetyltransferase [uncultured Tolumonas sp.]|uniref:GNAT family N-acetyltransferase n=1 Tax=uncultured Tolumonas sp. TaxID=263765 RepID=UPI002A0A215F|nr:GNAT family N-acetyltransferase [uncultured Tolumonas sp.]
MTQPVSQRQREQDALAWFFKHSPHIPDLHCKVAELSDLPALLHLERYCFNPYLAFGRRRWRYLISKSCCSTILLFQHETLVAYLCLLPHQGWCGLEVRALAVHWLHRQKGLGRWLMRLSQYLAQQWQLRTIYLSVDCENMPARTLYEQMGLQISGQLADYYGLDRHGLRMRFNVESDDTKSLLEQA